MRRLPPPGRAPILGTALGLGALVVATAALLPVQAEVTRTSPALVFVLAVVGAGVVGGRWAAVITAVAAFATFNLAFVGPRWSFGVDDVDDWVALGIFLAVALAVGLLVGAQAERRRTVQKREEELRTLYEHIQAMAEERERLTEEATRAQVLQRVDEQRAALLRSVSDDLRMPLASIRAVASDLRNGAAYDEDTRAELLDNVCDEAERLDRIVANLLSFSRTEPGVDPPKTASV